MTFASRAGRHSVNSYGKDMGLNKLEKVNKKVKNSSSLPEKEHKVIDQVFTMINDTISGTGLKMGEKVAATVITTAMGALIDNAKDQSTLSNLTHVQGLGQNDCTYTYTHCHSGVPTKTRLKKQLNTPNIGFNLKALADSSKDYQRHQNRKHLVVTSGFNQKSFCFFMEDTYLTVGNYLDFFSRDNLIEENLKKTTNGTINVYGCVYKTIVNFKFTNHFNYFNVTLKLHLIKVTDIHDDLRNLISEITNNSSNFTDILEQDLEQESNFTNTEESQDLLRKVVKKTKTIVKEVGGKVIKEVGGKVMDDIISKSNISKVHKVDLFNIIKDKSTFRGSDYGKLPEDKQYSDPVVTDELNKFSIKFLASLNTKLTDSVQFKDRAKIVHTWTKRLTPKSIWDFKLENHLGKGIHLNYLFDVAALNREHPSGYIFVLESFGDKRGKIVRTEDNDFFSGYSPSRLAIEFTHKLGYLAKDTEMDEPIPTVYRQKSLEEDFQEQSDYDQEYTPNRSEAFHIDFEDIQLLEDRVTPKKDRKGFVLEYDSVVVPNNTLMNDLQMNYRKHGFDGNHLTDDDLKFDSKTEPTVQDYEGTGQQEPSDDFIDLDN